MKNRILSSIAASTVLVLISTPSLAATTGSVLVTGTVSQVVSVAVASDQNSFSVTPGVAVSGQSLANISINSNDPDGYSVSLSALRNGSRLANTNNDEFMTYTVNYGSTSNISLSTTPLVVENTTGQSSGAIVRNLSLDIAANQSVGRSAEAYKDTVTITIAGK